METDELGQCDCGATYNVGSQTDHNGETGECWECSADSLRMWQRACPCCGATEYTDETSGGEPRSLGGSCPECATFHNAVWRDADEPHPAVWQS